MHAKVFRLDRISASASILTFIAVFFACADAAQAKTYDIAYATYLGEERWEQTREVIPYPDGSILVSAYTTSTNMSATPHVVQPRYAGDDLALGHGGIYGGDGFLMHLSADGSKLLYATYLGGSKDDMIRSVALGFNGEVYLVGSTSSQDFPVTANAAQSESGGGGDAFVVKLVPK